MWRWQFYTGNLCHIRGEGRRRMGGGWGSADVLSPSNRHIILWLHSHKCKELTSAIQGVCGRPKFINVVDFHFINSHFSRFSLVPHQWCIWTLYIWERCVYIVDIWGNVSFRIKWALSYQGSFVRMTVSHMTWSHPEFQWSLQTAWPSAFILSWCSGKCNHVFILSIVYWKPLTFF